MTAGRTWRRHAFGLELHGDFPAAMLAEGLDERHRPITRIRLVPDDEPTGWAPDGVRLLNDVRLPDGSPGLTVARDRAGFHRVTATGYGDHVVDPDGGMIWCRRAGRGDAWQRLLLAQALPLAAALQGHELLHASAVVADGRTLAFAGESGAGKSSLALAMVLRGHRILTDDVLALEPDGDTLIAHPGAGVLALRVSERPLVAQAHRDGTGRELLRAEKDVVTVAGVREPQRLDALFVVSRDPDASATVVTPIPQPGPLELLALTFSATITTRQRLQAQLAVHALLANEVPVSHLRIAPGDGPQDVAAEVLAHLGELPRC